MIDKRSEPDFNREKINKLNKSILTLISFTIYEPTNIALLPQKSFAWERVYTHFNLIIPSPQ